LIVAFICAELEVTFVAAFVVAEGGAALATLTRAITKIRKDLKTVFILR